MKLRSALIAGLALFACTACDGGIWVSAKVVDANGNPIPNASANLSFKDYKRAFNDSSDDAGCILLGGVIAPMTEEWQFDIRANGYKSFRTNVISAEQHTLLVTLQRVNSHQSGSSHAVAKIDGCAL